MKLISIQVGMPKTVMFRGRPISTGIYKYPVSGTRKADKLGLEGDGQADLRVHGGEDKAVYAFSQDAYRSWQDARPEDVMEPGIFGENLTFEHLSEADINIGDTFSLGSVVLQAAQPRFPCFKFGIRMGDSTALQQFLDLDRPGVYFRVLKDGSFQTGDRLLPLARTASRVSILRLFEIYKGADFEDVERQKILGLKELPDAMRKMLS